MKLSRTLIKDEVLTIEQNGDTIELYWRNDQMHIEIDLPWAGDTETGFGQTCSIMLDHAQVKAICGFLMAWLSNPEEKEEEL